MQRIIHLSNGVVRNPEWRLSAPASFELTSDEHIAIVGKNGSGKSLLVEMLMGRHPLEAGTIDYNFSPSHAKGVADNISYIAFRDTYGTSCNRTYYLQQRWNQTEYDEEANTVSQRLQRLHGAVSLNDVEYSKHLAKLSRQFHIDGMLDKNVILLSSGELRKLELFEALLTSPRVLIVDNPFIGLDAEARYEMTDMLNDLAENHGLQMILVLSNADSLPPFITHVVELTNKMVSHKMTREEFLQKQPTALCTGLLPEKRQAILKLPNKESEKTYQEIVRLSHVNIAYGQHKILQDICWTIHNGEKWALSGKNGSGKSTLLSLICADNPQSYACDITLFDKQRGSGESIWEIKRHIGYVSPELHRAFKSDTTVCQLIAGGLHDTIGKYARTTQEDIEKSLFWMFIFGIDTLAQRRYLQLSSGEQRLVLLARAFVKDPDLLILDEPFHGLDPENIALVQDIITTFMQRANKTLIMVSHFNNEYPSCIDKKMNLKPSTT